MIKKDNLNIEFSKAIHLFRDDLIAIELILKQDLSSAGFKVSFDEYESEDILSIPTDQKKTDRICFRISQPAYFTLRVQRYSTSMDILSDSLVVRGAISKIEEILENRTRSNLMIVRKFMYWFVSITLAYSVYTLVGFHQDVSNVLKLKLVALLILCVVSGLQMSFPIKSIVEFSFKKDRKNFWQRNKDQIIVGVLISAVAFLLGRL